MPADRPAKLEILLVADDAVRVSLLRRSMRANGLSCNTRRVGYGKKALAYLRRHSPYQTTPAPHLVLIDLAEQSDAARELVQQMAFGKRRSPIPVVLLSSPAAEVLLESGELDGGEATMFTARALDSFFRKLVGQRRAGFLKALATLYEYGPIILRLPEAFVESSEDAPDLSA